MTATMKSMNIISSLIIDILLLQERGSDEVCL